MEGQVPGGEPGILPLIRHRDDVEPVEVAPPGVPPGLAHGRRFGLGRVAVQPPGDIVVEQLLAPQHTGGGLPQHQRLIRARARRRQLSVELIRLGLALGHHLIEVRAERGRHLGRGPARPAGGRPEPEPELGGLPGRHGDLVPERALGPDPGRVDRGRAVDHVVVDAVLGVGRDRVGAIQPGQVGLVLAEQQLRAGAAGGGRGYQLQGARERVVDGDRPVAGGPQGRPGLVVTPGPGVAEPGGGQHVDGFGLRAGVGDLDGHQQVIRAGLGVVHLGDPVPVVVERAGVEQLVLGLVPAPAGVDIDQVLVGERALRVVVAPPVPGVAGDGIQVPPVLLDVLAVVALRAGQPERALLQDRIPPVPQRQAQAQPLLDVTEPGQAVLAPPVGLGPGVVVRQVIPRVAVGAVVLPDRPPLPLAEIRSPPVPLAALAQPVLQPAEIIDPLTFRTHHHSLAVISAPSRAPLPGPNATAPGRTSRAKRSSRGRWVVDVMVTPMLSESPGS